VLKNRRAKVAEGKQVEGTSDRSGTAFVKLFSE
jgi:hypothetical protein